MSNETKKRIEDALISLGIADEVIYSLGELEAVSEITGCPLIAIMGYLRNR